MRKLGIILLFCIVIVVFFQCNTKNDTPSPLQGTVKINFKNVVKGSPLTLNTASYTNQNNQTYTISKLKYYISNVFVNNIDKSSGNNEGYYLIDQADALSQSFSFNAKVEQYSHLNFTIGVDSLRNVSGAQTGALDPLNDMFWTWSSGYIMAKLEGNSPASTQVNNKLQYHIGGFSGVNRAVKKISITLPISAQLLNVRANRTSEIFIEADIDKWFSNNIDIVTEAAIMTPGPLSNKIATNYMGMFTVTQVVNN